MIAVDLSSLANLARSTFATRYMPSALCCDASRFGLHGSDVRCAYMVCNVGDCAGCCGVWHEMPHYDPVTNEDFN